MKISTVFVFIFLFSCSVPAWAKKNMNSCSSDLVMYHYLVDEAVQWEEYCKKCRNIFPEETKEFGDKILNKEVPGESNITWYLEFWGLKAPLPKSDYSKIDINYSQKYDFFKFFIKDEKNNSLLVTVENTGGLFSNYKEEEILESSALKWEREGFRKLFGEETNSIHLIIESIKTDPRTISCKSDTQPDDAKKLYTLMWSAVIGMGMGLYEEFYVDKDNLGYVTYKKRKAGEYLAEGYYVINGRKINVAYKSKNKELINNVIASLLNNNTSVTKNTPEWILIINDIGINETKDQNIIDSKLEELKNYGFEVLKKQK